MVQLIFTQAAQCVHVSTPEVRGETERDDSEAAARRQRGGKEAARRRQPPQLKALRVPVKLAPHHRPQQAGVRDEPGWAAAST
eukprot:CAMPEP_0202061850 /NCGR_PEP_ID=MMETSP0963-20130614/42280_1 /ASSEMBLY_ACC=CAM_ASM_000494 /TAXON_ID=4773 /ORGANISM="Schizochytrium aggregatum, Strain ATCC28209" /LENGTH=82 /DNA_ID=CAMNT_0048628097 /DNA_START=106 /DNA_END=351 /DNA_ORIENTATION=+